MTTMPDLSALLNRPGPFLNVAMKMPSAVADAAERFEIRIKNARRDLEEAGVDDDHLQRFDDCVAGIDHAAGAAVVIVQPAGGDPLVEYLVDDITDDVATVDPLPRLATIVEHRQRSIPHLMVVTDREGADLFAIDHGELADEENVQGETLHIHRGRPGGWSHRRFQQRAENRWDQNAEGVAEEVQAMAQRIDARLIAVTGDVRAVQFLRDHLDDELVERMHVVDGGSVEAMADETVRLAATVVAEDTRDVLRRHRDASAHGLGTSDPADTLEALAAGRVDTLLVDGDPDDERVASFDPDAPGGSLGESEDHPTARLIDVAIRGALLTDAEVAIVPSGGRPEQLPAAILRW